MKLVQFFLPGKGKRIGLVRGDRVMDITSTEEGVRSTLDLVTQGRTLQGMMTRATWLARRLHRGALGWREIQRPPSRRFPHLLVPIDAPEVWGVKPVDAAEIVREEHAETSGGLDGTPDPALPVGDRRPALYFKATAHRVVGPHAPIAIRQDSVLTVPEANVAVVLGLAGSVVAFTVCNDVTARDIEQSGPEFLGQAKTYLGSCALGPCLVTPDEIEGLCALQLRCTIIRHGAPVFSETARGVRAQRPVETLVGWLCRHNSVPPGTVLSTGTEILVPDSMALSDGDQVDIEVERIGRLSNPVRRS